MLHTEIKMLTTPSVKLRSSGKSCVASWLMGSNVSDDHATFMLSVICYNHILFGIYTSIINCAKSYVVVCSRVLSSAPL
jgi:hypothetical protein